MIQDFSNYVIKEYRYWTVNIFYNQGYLGRCVVWCKRGDAVELVNVTDGEQKELFIVLRDLRTAVNKLFQPDWFNYAFLGNKTRHLHCHVVPRYATPRVFMGMTFEDKLYGHNFQTDSTFVMAEKILSEIKTQLKNTLG